MAAMSCQGLARQTARGATIATEQTRLSILDTRIANTSAAAFDRSETSSTVAQKSTSKRSVQPPSAVARSVPPRRSTSRLPAHYGKLGVSRDQRTTIYEIQARYGDQIHDLELQIRELRDKQRMSVEAVLSSEQLVELKRYRAAAAKKQAERRQRGSQKRTNED